MIERPSRLPNTPNHRRRPSELVEAEDPGVRFASAIAGKVVLALDPVKEAIAKELQQRLPFLWRKHCLKDLAVHQPIVELAGLVVSHQCVVPILQARRKN